MTNVEDIVCLTQWKNEGGACFNQIKAREVGALEQIVGELGSKLEMVVLAHYKEHVLGILTFIAITSFT